VLAGVEAPSEADLARVAAGFAGQVPDRARAPLFRALLVRLAQREHVLLLGVDHILCDGTSLQLIRRELAAGYAAALRGEELPGPPRIRHLDWAAWQRRLLSGERLEHLVAAWRRRLGERRPLLAFPLPAPAGGRDVPSVARARLAVAPELTAAIRRRCREWG